MIIIIDNKLLKYFIIFFLFLLLFNIKCIFCTNLHKNNKKSQLIVHIGPSKTGTTTIQSSIAERYDQLISAGYYPLSKNRGLIHTRVEIEKVFNEYKDNITDNFFQDAIDNKLDVVISCEYLGSRTLHDISIYDNVFKQFNTTIVMFYRDFISIQISLHYQRRSLDSLLSYLTDPMELKLNPITIGANSYLDRMLIWNRYDKLILIDYNGLVANSMSLQYVFICKILNIACNDSSLQINKISNPTTVARINDVLRARVADLLRLYCDQRHCVCNILLFQKELNMTIIPTIPINLSHMVKYSILLDEEFRNKYGHLLLYSNKTATIEAIHKNEILNELDWKHILLNEKWVHKFDDTLKYQIKTDKAKCTTTTTTMKQ